MMELNEYCVSLPNRINLPFFAYGIFKPGQIAYSRIAKYEKEPPEMHTIKHKMCLRDGIPFILSDVSEYHSSEGFLFEFNEDESELAYKTICESISKKLYYWKEIDVDGQKANALIGKKPSRSRPQAIDGKFDGSNDPYFKEALELIRDDMGEELDFWKMNDYFRLQRNYMLLWSAVERYASLRYGPHNKSTNNEKLASEEFFQESLKCHVPKGETRDIYRTDTLRKITLDCDTPEDSIDYYYTLRCNMVHRGKSLYNDADFVSQSLDELLKIFNDVLECTFK